MTVFVKSPRVVFVTATTTITATASLCKSGPDRLQRQVQGWKDIGGEGIAFRKDAGRNFRGGIQGEDLHCSGFRIHEPEFPDPVAGVEVPLQRPIPIPGPWREDLHHEVGGTVDPIPDDGEPLVGDEQNVRLRDGILSQNDIEGSGKDLPEHVGLDVLGKGQEEVP